MGKKFLAFSLVVVALTCASPLTVLATHVHDFSAHQSMAPGPTTTSTHTYEYGKDHNNNIMYRTCTVTTKHYYCMYKCTMCSILNEAYGSHTHVASTHHSECGQ